MSDGLILDRYEPLGTAGSGGFATVQVAWDPRIQRKVAIKTIRLTEQDAHRAGLPGADALVEDGMRDDSDADSGANLAAIVGLSSLAHLPGLDEARTAGRLGDPRIVTVYDFEVRDRTAYLIMEYVEGITCTRLLADYADHITLDVVAAVFDAVAGALTAAHEAGVLHLDIKPDNILVNAKGEVKVTDFGLATLADASGRGTAGGGTIGYMPLEQMRRQHLDARTDEWSLASVAYEMLTGDNPFRVPSLADAERAIEDAELVLPSLCWENLDEQIDDVVFYALAPEADERYATVKDFAEEADKFLGDAQAGRAQIAALVQDALGLNHVDDADVDAEDGSDENRRPISLPPRALSIAARAFGAAASGLIVACALANLPVLDSAFGDGALYVKAAGIAATAGLGALRPHIGALVSFCALGISLCLAGHPLVGGVLIAATIAWWATIARPAAGPAPANVALFTPLIGAIGGASAIPLFSGALLRPVPALATTALAAVVSCVLAGFGSQTIMGWDALSNWSFIGVDVTGNVVALVQQPATWATVAGWLACSGAASLFATFGKKWLTITGLALGCALLVIGSLALAEPTPQLIVPAVLAAALLLARP